MPSRAIGQESYIPLHVPKNIPPLKIFNIQQFFHSKQKSSIFDLDLGRVGEFSSDPMLCLNSEKQ